MKKNLPADAALFVLQFFKHPHAIGALMPSSKALAECMSRYVEAAASTPKRYLEVGAGTGAFTHTIAGKLGGSDVLDLVEINPQFCRRLEEKYAGVANIHVHNASILDWKPAYRYDAIISSLPFNAFEADFVSQILNYYQSISQEGATVTFCEYMALPDIRKLFISQKSRTTLQETLEVVEKFKQEHGALTDKVFANFPPALVHHCKMSL